MSGTSNIGRVNNSHKYETGPSHRSPNNTRPSHAVKAFILPVAGLLGIAGLEAVSIVANLPQAHGDLSVVVAWPWGLSAEEIAQAAGGRVIGPVTKTTTVLATGASAEALKAAGAMLVLDETYAGLLCGTTTGEE